MSDHYATAINAWYGANSDLKVFAEACALVDGSLTAALASDCKLSVDSIEGYRNAARLLHEMQTQIETPSETYRIWREANVSLWVAAAKHRGAHPLEKLHEYLTDAVNNRSTVEAFRVMLDSKGGRPDWERRLKTIIRSLGRFRTDYKGVDMPEAVRVELDAAVSEFETALARIAQMEAE